MKNLDSEMSRVMTRPPAPAGQGWQAVYTPDESFVGFDGHFPGYPLLPAFVQVSLAVHLLGRALGRPQKLDRIGTAKFASQAKPGEALDLECLPVTTKSGEAAWDCTVSKAAAPGDGDELVAKFRLHLLPG